MGILRRFHYIDDEQLNQYISQVEDGLRSAANRSEMSGKVGNLNLGPKYLGVGGSLEGGAAVAETYDDNSASRFERLLNLVENHEDEFGWKELDPEFTDIDAFAGLKVGHILSCATELYESDVTAISGSAGILKQLPLMAKIASMTGGESPFGALDEAALSAMAAFGEAMNGNNVILGEVPEFDFTIVASVPVPVRSDSYAYVVGKIVKIWRQGSWRPLPNLPIVSQMPREQRREYERKGPGKNDKMMWVEGPAVQLDLLAIYQ